MNKKCHLKFIENITSREKNMYVQLDIFYLY